MRGIICLAVLVGIIAAVLSGSGGDPVYPMTMERTRQILSKTDLPPVFGSNPVIAQTQSNKPSEVVWIVSSNGIELMRYTATLAEAGQDKTRVAVELKGSKGGSIGDVEKRFAENPAIKNLYLVAMKEKIAASIEKRDMDMSRINAAMGAAVMGNIGNIRRSVDEAAKASEELERSHPRRRGG